MDSLVPSAENPHRSKLSQLPEQKTSQSEEHELLKNFLPPATDGKAFDMWARAMKLDDMALEPVDEDSPVHPANNTEIVAQVGGTALLSCYTGHMSDDMVSNIFTVLYSY